MTAVPAPLESRVLGDIRITWLPDGVGRFDPSLFFPQSDPAIWETHADAVDDDRHLVASIGALLVETSSDTVLIDTGLGDTTLDVPLGTARGGRLLQSLARVGLAPGAIDAVVYTHLHADHVGWTTSLVGDEYELVFSNARHVMHSAEWDFWVGRDDHVGMRLDAMERPLAECVELLEGGQSVVPGVSLLHAPGHTPGHVAVVVADRDARAIVLGDAIHSPAQFEEHHLGCVADTDPAQAHDTQRSLFDELLRPRTGCTGVHFPNSVFGRVIVSEPTLRWVNEWTADGVDEVGVGGGR